MAAPEHTVKVGGIQLSLWANDSGKGVFYSTTIDKSYKEGNDWKKSKSFSPTDLMKVQLGITKVLEYLFVKDVITPVVASAPKTEAPPTSKAGDEVVPF